MLQAAVCSSFLRLPTPRPFTGGTHPHLQEQEDLGLPPPDFCLCIPLYAKPITSCSYLCPQLQEGGISLPLTSPFTGQIPVRSQLQMI